MTEKEFFDRYSFNVREDKIGGGSFGTVYRAYDNVLDREIAVKVSEVRISGDKEFSLRAEFKAIEKLPPHANIANYEEVHTFESLNGVFDYAIMQYYPLGNLDHFLSTNNLNHAKKEGLVLAILEGISHLHEHHIFQRDLKPSNILVVNRKGKLVPKITDFGLSKAAGDGKASRFTNSFAGGTLQYCSPEQIKGLPLKLNTDLWSFGAIAYEIFMGRALFQVSGSTSASAEWQNEVSKKILHEDYSEKLKQLPGNWPSVVAACLERDMEQRVQNAGELLRILKGLPQEEGIYATTQILPTCDNDDTQIFSKQSQEVEPGPVVAKPATQVEQVREEAPKEQPTKPRPKRKNIRMWFGIAAGLAAAFAIGYFFTSTTMAEASETGLNSELVLFQKDSLFGYKIGNSTVIQPAYADAEDFNNNRAKVTTPDSTFFIDGNGDWIASNTDERKEEAIMDSSVKKEKNKEEDIKEAVKELSLAEQQAIYKKGRELYDQGKKEDAYKILLKVADQGYTDAQYLVGRYLHTRFLRDMFNTKLSDSALSWYLKAAKKGHLQAQVDLGHLYSENPYTRDQAEKWYLKAADNGYVPAYGVLGRFYENFNDTLSHKWILKGAEAGDVSEMMTLAFNYDKGDGVEKDLEQSSYWMKKAAEAGDLAAMNFYAYDLEKGEGVAKDVEEAKKWLKKIISMKGSEDYDYWAKRAKEDLKRLQ